jgi:hypothetical protein
VREGMRIVPRINGDASLRRYVAKNFNVDLNLTVVIYFTLIEFHHVDTPFWLTCGEPMR